MSEQRREADMHSTRGFVGAIVLLVGVPIALASALLFNGAGASEIIHLALGASFLLFAAAVFDFRQPAWLNGIFAFGIGLLAAIFLLQAVADLTRWTPLADIAYGILGQSLEKVLGFVFIAWCAALVVTHSRGTMRWVGIAALAVVIAVEVYGVVISFGGETAPAVLKFLYLPLIAWLGLECRAPRATEAMRGA
jgi:branched-subunit amino acid transport protein